MKAVEDELSRYLADRARDVVVRPDLNAILRPVPHRARVGRRRLGVAVAVGVLAVVLLVIVVVTTARGHARVNIINTPPTDSPSPAPNATPTTTKTAHVSTSSTQPPRSVTSIQAQTATSTSTEPSSAPTTSGPVAPRAGNGLIILADGLGLSQVDLSGAHNTIPLPKSAAAWRAPSWAPDGRRFAFADGRQIKVEDIATGATTQVASCASGLGCQPAWSPDGRSLAYADGETISVVQADGPPTQSGMSLAQLGGVPTDLSWTPDSQTIIYALNVPSPSFGVDGIASVSRDGSSHHIILGVGSAPLYSDVTLSPDGTKIAFLGASFDTATSVFSLAVMTVNVDGSALTTVRQIGSCGCIGLTPGLAWSPDGTKLAVVSPEIKLTATGEVDRQPTSPFLLYILSADGTTLTPAGVQASGTPSWQPIPQ